MVKKKFIVEGKVQNVGFRPFLCGRGMTDYNLKVYPKNDPQNNRRLIVVVEGRENKVYQFHQDVKRGELQPEDAEVERVSDFKEFKENPNKWMEYSQGLQLYQMGKFVSVGKGIRKEIKKLPERIAKAIKES